MKSIIVIPARLNSTRLPGKVLLDLKGSTVVHHVYKQCIKANNIDAVYIATDSLKVKQSCEKFTQNIIMTAKEHISGTDRISEALQDIHCDIVVNVQGDEPFISPKLIQQLVNALKSKSVMASAMSEIDNIRDLKNPNIVKVITDHRDEALYFSRSIIPYPRNAQEQLLKNSLPKSPLFYKHIGIYAYKKDFLLKLSKMHPSPLEKIESLEQLRVIENGHKIKMIQTDYHSIGIDTQEDYEVALGLM